MSSSNFGNILSGSGQLIDHAGNSCSLPDLPPDGVLGLYFTAQCFTDDFAPKLVDFCQRLKQNPSAKQFAIVAVSLDDDQSGFDDVRKALPWPTLRTYNEAGTKIAQALRRRYRCHRLPSLILVESLTGRLITDIGRQYVLSDPVGSNFPWYPQPLSAVLSSGRLMNGSKELVESKQALEGKVKALYFSSYDCAPCLEFTSLLVESYVRIQSAGCPFEVILVSGDETESEFSENYSLMPWLALPYNDLRINQLESHFQVVGYPQLILLDADNQLITTEGCSVIMNDPKGWNFPWPIQVAEELNDDTEIVVRFRPCLILLTGGRDELINQAVTLLAEVAKEYQSELKASRSSSNSLPDLHFLYEGHRSSDAVETLIDNLQLVAQTQQMSQTTQLRPRVVLVDIKNNNHFVCWSDENSSMDAVTDESLHYLVNKYKNGTLALRQIPDLPV